MIIKNQIFAAILLFLLPLSSLISNSDSLRELDINLENYEYPYPVQFFELNVQQKSMEMAYMDVKPEEPNGKNVLLLHGKNFNGAYWESTINSLVKEGYRVIIPDQIGFGKSTKPKNFHYTFHQLAENTRLLLSKLNIEKISVLGHSMGGMLASRFELMYPELTEKLILLNPIGLEDWKTMVPYKNVDWWYERELEKDYESIKAYQLNSYYDGNWKEKYDEWVNLLAGWTLNDNYNLIAWNSALTYDMIFTQPVCYEFENIQSPTLLIIGTRDRTALGKQLVDKETRSKLGNYDKLGKITDDKIPNSKLVELKGIGHLPHIEAFEEYITPLLEFLKK